MIFSHLYPNGGVEFDLLYYNSLHKHFSIILFPTLTQVVSIGIVQLIATRLRRVKKMADRMSELADYPPVFGPNTHPGKGPIPSKAHNDHATDSNGNTSNRNDLEPEIHQNNTSKLRTRKTKRKYSGRELTRDPSIFRFSGFFSPRLSSMFLCIYF